MKRLSEYTPNLEMNRAKPLTEIANIEVTVEGFVIRQGRYGDVAVMTVALEDGEREKVITGSKVIIQALKSASVGRAFPVKAIFRKQGQSWTIE